jgi:hypothetical protein
LLVVVTVFVGGGLALRILPREPAPLPSGATPLSLRTEPWKLWPIGGFGCPMALISPIRVERDGTTMTFASVEGPGQVPVVWPHGYSARLLAGRAELVAPDGSVLAAEGATISNLSGGAADNGDLLLCFDLASATVVEPSS